MDISLMGLRQFRERLDTVDEVVKVVRTRGEITVLGLWIPASGWLIETEGENDVLAIRINRKVPSPKR